MSDDDVQLTASYPLLYLPSLHVTPSPPPNIHYHRLLQYAIIAVMVGLLSLAVYARNALLPLLDSRDIIFIATRLLTCRHLT